MVPTEGFWAYRAEQEALGRANGMQPFSTKAFYAAMTGIVSGVGYGALYWAYYPDKFAFSHKNTVTSGPSRGMVWIRHTVLRPTVMFSVVGLTFAGVESLMEELRGSHHKEPINAAYAGAAAGVVLGGFMTKRFDVATMTGLGMGMLMGLVELNGSNLICDPQGQAARKFPVSMHSQFQESTVLNELKEKYPAYKSN